MRQVEDVHDDAKFQAGVQTTMLAMEKFKNINAQEEQIARQATKAEADLMVARDSVMNAIEKFRTKAYTAKVKHSVHSAIKESAEATRRNQAKKEQFELQLLRTRQELEANRLSITPIVKF